jgi:hypothetical protein
MILSANIVESSGTSRASARAGPFLHERGPEAFLRYLPLAAASQKTQPAGQTQSGVERPSLSLNPVNEKRCVINSHCAILFQSTAPDRRGESCARHGLSQHLLTIWPCLQNGWIANSAKRSVLAAGLWPAYADARRLENFLTNLAINVRHAVPNSPRGYRFARSRACRAAGSSQAARNVTYRTCVGSTRGAPPGRCHDEASRLH